MKCSKSFQKSDTEQPMLSLDKTKEVEVTASILSVPIKCCISWKMDGLTVVLTYRDGTLL